MRKPLNCSRSHLSASGHQRAAFPLLEVIRMLPSEVAAEPSTPPSEIELHLLVRLFQAKTVAVLVPFMRSRYWSRPAPKLSFSESAGGFHRKASCRGSLPR